MFSPQEPESPLFPGKHPEALAEQSSAELPSGPDLFPESLWGHFLCGGGPSGLTREPKGCLRGH